MHAESFTFHIRDVLATVFVRYGTNLVQVYAASLARPPTTAKLADFATAFTRAGGWRGACGRYAEVTAATIVSYYRIICRQLDLNELRTNVELEFRSTSVCTLQFHCCGASGVVYGTAVSMYSTCNSS